jgi:hypothetical protein
MTIRRATVPTHHLRSSCWRNHQGVQAVDVACRPSCEWRLLLAHCTQATTCSVMDSNKGKGQLEQLRLWQQVANCILAAVRPSSTALGEQRQAAFTWRNAAGFTLVAAVNNTTYPQRIRFPAVLGSDRNTSLAKPPFAQRNDTGLNPGRFPLFTIKSVPSNQPQLSTAQALHAMT